MFVMVVGVNHRIAPVEIREKLSVSEGTLTEKLRLLCGRSAVEGCVILSTCNRTEIYASAVRLDEGLQSVWEFLSEKSGIDICEIKNCTYVHTLHDAARHLFRVACGLDSMVIGETQILGQVRDAYTASFAAGTSDSTLNILFQHALTTGKKVRLKTGIDRHCVSVSYAAVELARQTLGSLKGLSVLLVGAGKMSELTVRHLLANGISGVVVSNRSYERARRMAEKFDGRAAGFDELAACMEQADIVISCTNATHLVIRREDVERVMRKRGERRLLIVDIAVPRDVDPAAAGIPGVMLCDVDELQNVADHSLEERKAAALEAEGIIEGELKVMKEWLACRSAVPAISCLKELGESIKQKELARALNRLGGISDHDRKVISSMANSIVKQLLHRPVTSLKEYAVTPEGQIYIEALQNLFKLEVQDNGRKGCGGGLEKRQVSEGAGSNPGYEEQ